MADGVECIHAGNPVRESTGYCQAKVDVPKRFGGLGDPGRQLGVLYRSRRLCAIQLHATHAQHRKDCHG